MGKLSVVQKLEILSDAAKYDVSCASSGSKRKNTKNGLGNSSGMGICHSYTQDGRCVSLLKILLTNFCIFDCAYCVTRKSNDIRRTAFTVDEVVDLTINFYKRNYIEGLFLSSGIFKSADYTMERLVRVAKKLRKEHDFNGYIHLKAIPGASDELLYEAGLYADRLSVNIEMPSEKSLKLVAPEKSFKDAMEPMEYLKGAIQESKIERQKFRHAPKVSPGGQSTQLVIGASPENDKHILELSDQLYVEKKLKRVYYSGYVPISDDPRLPIVDKTPVLRENRLYQADWLMRFYKFDVNDIVNDEFPDLDIDIDPKAAHALRNPHLFPVDINKAEYHSILKIPGVGVKSAKKIIAARKFRKLNIEHLKKIGVIWKRAQFFIECGDSKYTVLNASSAIKRQFMLPAAKSTTISSTQLSLFQ
ncbi:putative DNA modification/repair radical SAM protein [Portibacter lacus]|uniref:DNA modification/repair radical SAM protein n=1 Tax=Portibacter lacus TaxID=1099794 RepID=A0AA37WEC0_9BACT|nr:putative DNA modification/repair radical SAM protein [Portibacter lacus]GLR16544.1 putative DNA modification/repair radical SAM protein [Portibacter lacus]